MHAKNSFVTLTYDPEHLPISGSLQPDHTKNFLKKLRARIAPEQIRFLLVGEYGERTLRPHYHASIFGLGMEDHAVINSSWEFGHAQIDDFNWKTAQYVAGYLLKKMMADTPPSLTPEFTRQSLRPGIGAPAIPVIAQAIWKNGSKALDSYGDVPTAVRINGKLCPIGRYLTSRLREYIGMPTQSTSPLRRRPKHYQEILDQKSLERSFKMHAVHFNQKGLTITESIKLENQGRAASLSAREKIHRSTRSL